MECVGLAAPTRKRTSVSIATRGCRAIASRLDTCVLTLSDLADIDLVALTAESDDLPLVVVSGDVAWALGGTLMDTARLTAMRIGLSAVPDPVAVTAVIAFVAAADVVVIASVAFVDTAAAGVVAFVVTAVVGVSAFIVIAAVGVVAFVVNTADVGVVVFVITAAVIVVAFDSAAVVAVVVTITLVAITSVTGVTALNDLAVAGTSAVDLDAAADVAIAIAIVGVSALYAVQQAFNLASFCSSCTAIIALPRLCMDHCCPFGTESTSPPCHRSHRRFRAVPNGIWCSRGTLTTC